jgi:hypothetical protein
MKSKDAKHWWSKGSPEALLEQRLYAISVSLVIQAFCPAKTSVYPTGK